MPRYEYKVVPAPRTPARVKGVKGDEARFAFTLEGIINASALEGWEYVRSDTLPCIRRGWFSRSVEDRTIMIFRRGSAEQVVRREEFAHSELPPEPRLAADRSAPRRSSAPALRAQSVPGSADRGIRDD